MLGCSWAPYKVTMYQYQRFQHGMPQPPFVEQGWYCCAAAGLDCDEDGTDDEFGPAQLTFNAAPGQAYLVVLSLANDPIGSSGQPYNVTFSQTGNPLLKRGGASAGTSSCRYNTWAFLQSFHQ